MSRQSIVGLLGAAALAAAVCLAPAFTAAQTLTERLFITNEDSSSPLYVQASNAAAPGGGIAQEFTTGDFGANFVPRKLTLWFDGDTADNIDASNLTVAIWRNGTDGPLVSSDPMNMGGPYISFANPSNLGGGGAREFTHSPVGLGLEPNVTYHVVVQYNSAEDAAPLWIQHARHSAISESLDGWSLGMRRTGLDGAWDTPDPRSRVSSARLRFRLEGNRLNIAATGEPDVPGDGEVGLTLTANPGDIDDGNGIGGVEYEYQWLRYEADSDINVVIMSGGQPVTGTTYTITSDDLGQRVGVKAVFTDDDGHSEERFSGPETRPVVAATWSEIRRYSGNSSGGPVITGTLRVGETITIDLTGVSDPDDNQPPPLTGEPRPIVNASYVNIDRLFVDETHSSSSTGVISVGAQRTGDFEARYRIPNNYLGVRLRACWFYQEGGFFAPQHVVCSRLYGPVLDRAEGRPVIDGEAVTGSTLTALQGTIADPEGVPAESTFSYQWMWVNKFGRNESEIAGATGRTYTLPANAQRRHIAVRVSFTDLMGNSEIRTSDPIPESNNGIVSRSPIGKPEITDTFRSGQTLTVDVSHITDPDGLSNPMWRYIFWHVPLTVRESDLRDVDSVDEGTDMFGEVDTASITVPAINSDQVGQRKAVVGVFGFDDGGHRLEFFSNFSNVLVGPNNDARGKPEIVGTARAGETLEAVTDPAAIANDFSDADGLPDADTYTYQWERETATDIWVDIEGATESAYVLALEDGDKRVRVTVRFIDNLDASESLTSDPYPSSGTVDGDAAASGEPEITGAAAEGVTLMASPGNIADANGLTGAAYTYAWYRQDVDGSNRSASPIGTGDSYRLVTADVGKRIVVVASFTDDDSNAGSRESVPYPMSGAVVANVPATGKPAITGVASEGHTLMVSPGIAPNGIADDNGLTRVTYTYEWYRQDTDGSNRSASAIHTGDSYLLAAADVGKHIVAIARFTDDVTNQESRESDPYPSSGSVTDNIPATGTPEITGTPNAGQVLVAVTDPAVIADDIGDQDGIPDPPAYTYVWEREETTGNWRAIGGATSHNYLLEPADGDKRVRVVVIFTDQLSNSERLTSAPFPPRGSISGNYFPAGKPAVSGIATAGQNLMATPGNITDGNGLTGAAYTYEWYRQDPDGSNRSPNPIHTGSSYTLVAADIGKQIVVIAKFSDDSAYNESRNSDPYPRGGTVSENSPATGTPEISGTASVGETLTAVTDPAVTVDDLADDDGLPAASAYAYQWVREDGDGSNRADIPNATSLSYTLTGDDGGKKIRVRVIFRDNANAAESRESDAYPAVGTVRALPAGLPAITGTVAVGGTLTADTSAIMDPNGLTTVVYTYQWQRVDADGSNPVDLATTATYQTVLADVRKRLRVTVNFDDDEGSSHTLTSENTPIVNVPATGDPAISGTARVGETLAASVAAIADGNGISSAIFAYQWQRADDAAGAGAADIAGATSETYTPVKVDDQGKFLRVAVTFTDDDGIEETRQSAWSAQVAKRVNSVATGAPTISGTVKAGQILTADASAISDVNGTTGVTFAYQWQRQSANAWTPVGNDATTYTLTAADIGMRIRVEVSFDDEDGYPESVASDATAPATSAANNLATGAPEVVGVAMVGRILLAIPGTIDDADVLSTLSYAYQWQRGEPGAVIAWSDIAGANSSTYTLTAADEGMKVRVKTAFTDDGGSLEELPSGAYPAGASAVGPAAVSASGPADSAFAIERISDESIDEPAAGTVDLAFAVTLARSASHTSTSLTVDYGFTGTAREGRDFVEHGGPQRLVFGTGVEEQIIIVTVNSDIVAESGGETLVVTLANPSQGASLGANSSASVTISEQQGQINVVATEPQYAREDRTVSFGISLSERAPVAGLVEWRLVFDGDGAPAASARSVEGRAAVSCNLGSPCAGSAMFQAGSFDPTEDTFAVFDSVLPPGSVMRLHVKPFAAFPGSAMPADSMTAVQPSPRLASDEAETVTGGWVVAGKETLVMSYPGELVHAVAGFGHSVASGIVDGIWGRGAARHAGDLASRVTLGGKTLDTQALSSGDAGRTVREVASLLGIEATVPDGALDGLAGGHRGGIDDYRAWAGIPDSSRLASQSSFALTAVDGTGRGKAAFWGESSTAARKSKPEEGSSVETELSDMLLGFDLPGSDKVLYGLVVSRSSGESDYRDVSTDTAIVGTVETSLTTLAPYLYWSDASEKGLWASIGMGSGILEMSIDGSASDADIGITMLAAGARSAVARSGKVDYALRGDVYWAAISADRTAGFSELSAEASRIRVTVEGVSDRALESGAVSTNRIELGARMDSGDGEEGAGADMAVEIRYVSAGGGLEMAGRASVLLLHQQEGFREWGAGLGVAYSAGGNGRGASLSLEPTWNVPRTGVAESMWGTRDLDGYASSDAGAAMKARLGYGVGAWRDRAVATPYGQVETGEDSQKLRLGVETRGLAGPLERLSLDVYGQREERVPSRPSDSIMLEGSLGF